MTAVQSNADPTLHSRVDAALSAFSESGKDLILQNGTLQTITFNEIATNLIQKGFEESLKTHGHCYVSLTFSPNPASGILILKKTSPVLFEIESNYIPLSKDTDLKVTKIFMNAFGSGLEDTSICKKLMPSCSSIFDPKPLTVSFHIDLRADHTLTSKL